MNPTLAPQAVVVAGSAQDARELWTEIVTRLTELVPRSMLITWFKDTAILGREGSTLIVGLPLPMYLSWHMERYRQMTLQKAKEVDRSIETIIYKVDMSLQNDPLRSIDVIRLFPAKNTKPRKLPNRPDVRTPGGLTGRVLSPRFTLDPFVVGSCNRLAHAACQAVAGDPGGKYNPLFIYGGVGLGKTHLLQAVGNSLLHHNPDATVLYVTSEQFTNQVIEGIAKQKMELLRKRYREVDMLIIDDVQFFASKDRCQEEFFHTFNTLLHAGKQVILSSDKPPQELHDVLQPRLRSRFERGMIADVQRPDFETRVAILSQRALEYEIMLDQEVIHYIAQHVQDSVRTLEGILMQAVAQYELEQRTPTVKSIAEILRKLSCDPYERDEDIGFVTPARRAPTFDDVLEGVSSYYSISIQDIMSASRVKEVLHPRQAAMYLANKHLKMSSVRIGALFGGRDHTTVLHAIGKITKMVENDANLLRELRTIEEDVGLR